MERDYLPGKTGAIYRPRLNALLQEGLRHQLVTLVAAPGYGKTLAVSQFMRKTRCQLIWLRFSGDRDNNDQFWADFVRAAERELTDLSGRLQELRFPETPRQIDILQQLIADVARPDNRLVVVVDDYEHILSNSLSGFFHALMERDLPNFTLFILCNTRIAFSSARPVRGRLAITERELAFTCEEAESLFLHYGLAPSRLEIELAVERTDGWPLALQFLCASGQGGMKGAEGRTPFHIAAELFEEHYYANYPERFRRMLIHLSLLPDFPLDMVVKARDSDGDSDSDDTYKRLWTHPFVSYDHETGLFTLQKMYHGFLRRKQALINSDDRRSLLISAGEWYLRHDRPYEAMDCYWDAASYDGFMQAVFNLPRVRQRISVTNGVLQRLGQIPRAYALAHPIVDFCRAYMYMNASEMDTARSILLALAETLADDDRDDDHRKLYGDVCVTLADISIYMNDDSGLAWIKKAAAAIPEGCRTHSTEIMAIGNNGAFYLPSHGAGQVERMVDYYFVFYQYADPITRGSGHGHEYLFAGEAAFYQGDMERATQMFDSAILKAQQMDQHDIICNAIWGHMRVGLYYGSLGQATRELARLEAYINSRSLIGLYELRDCAASWYYLKLGDLAAVSPLLPQALPGPTEYPVSIGRNRLVQAYYLSEIGERSKAFAILTELESMLPNRGLWQERFWLYIIKARMLLADGREAEGLRDFHLAYAMTYANDLKAALCEFGRDTALLIERARDHMPDLDFAWLDAVHKDALSYAKRLKAMRRAYGGEIPAASPLPALTAREDETLHYLAQGLTQGEIARLMGVSVSAVKKHIGKIYTKLGAVNRADAIHIASVNGLLGAE